MITIASINNVPRMAIAIPQINSRDMVQRLRDALLDVITTCIATEDNKEATDSKSLLLVMYVVNELNKDVDERPP